MEMTQKLTFVGLNLKWVKFPFFFDCLENKQQKKIHKIHLITQNSLHLYNLLEGTLPM